jgi:CRISPR/Cas system-associated exonuclease Cas4 (RecB family)
MATEERRSPYIWPTWITGLLSGDKQCAWAAWFRSHHTYDKRPDDGAAKLTQWKAEHAEAVRTRAAALRAEGWDVSLEGQNKFTVHGKSATVGGVADIVARRAGEARVEDCKTGQRRESDAWQVILYLLLLPAADESLRGLALTGAVAYRDGLREVSMADAQAGKALAYRRIQDTAGDEVPARVPSPSECRFCDIACCPDRATGQDAAGETGEF